MECSNCKRNFAWHLHGRDGCHYHSGFLQPMTSTSCDDRMDTEPSMAEFLQSRRWSCCQQAGNNPGCNWGRHQLRQPAQSLDTISGVRVGGNAFHSARGMKRRSSDDDNDSDSSADGGFTGGRGCGGESSVGFRSMATGGFGAKMRRVERREGMGAPALGLEDRDGGSFSFFTGSHPA
ncbi:hypothetical protein ACHAQA_006276 [Verticillium albo-atrum]